MILMMVDITEGLLNKGLYFEISIDFERIESVSKVTVINCITRFGTFKERLCREKLEIVLEAGCDVTCMIIDNFN